MDSNGAVSTSLQVPESPGGPRSIGITEPSRGSAQKTFTVTPLLSLDRLNSSPGASVNASGVGFSANENTITVMLGQTPVATGISADAKGSWRGSLLIPSLPAGSHTVRAFGSLTSSSKVPTLNMTLGAAIILDRSSGSPATALKVSGSGFAPRDNIKITAGDALIEVVASSDLQGAWTADLTIPPAPSGSLTIRASGATGQPKEIDFRVTPTVSLSQATGTPGSLVTIEGKGFRANQSGIPIKFGGAVVASPSANSNGSWTSTLTVPQSPAGTRFIEISGASPTLEVPFAVTPTISLAGTLGEPGSSVTVTGSGFGTNEKGITVTLGQTPVAAGISANTEGSWSVSFPLPSLPTGSYSIQSSGSRTSVASVPEVNLTIGADLIMERSSGPPGTSFRVSGAGFRARENIVVTVGTGLSETNVASNAEGAWTANISIPAAPGGPLIIRASGSSGLQLEADFTVTPIVVLSQPIGSSGSSITIQGDGFTADLDISIRFGSGVIASSSADTNGSWTAGITLPESPAGTYTILVSGSAGELKVPFLLTPALVLSGTRGEPGVSVTVSGFGFAANENGIIVTLDRTQVASGISADNRGSWTASFLVPSSPSASYPVLASGPLTSSSDLRNEVLSIVPGLEINPSSGEPGSVISVTGRGFSAKQRDIIISYDGTVVATVLTSDPVGSFTTTFVVPLSASGLHFIGHSGSLSDAQGGSEVSIQVIPSISLDQFGWTTRKLRHNHRVRVRSKR